MCNPRPYFSFIFGLFSTIFSNLVRIQSLPKWTYLLLTVEKKNINKKWSGMAHFKTFCWLDKWCHSLILSLPKRVGAEDTIHWAETRVGHLRNEGNYFIASGPVRDIIRSLSQNSQLNFKWEKKLFSLKVTTFGRSYLRSFWHWQKIFPEVLNLSQSLLRFFDVIGLAWIFF